MTDKYGTPLSIGTLLITEGYPNAYPAQIVGFGNLGLGETAFLRREVNFLGKPDEVFPLTQTALDASMWKVKEPDLGCVDAL